MHNLLKLQHRRHTAKRLPHQHTSYRGLWLIVIIFGLTIVALQYTNALSIDVNASVPAPIPTQPAYITNPTTNTTVTVNHADLSGTCEILTTPYSVTLWRDTTSIGSTPCLADGTFAIRVTLIAGDNNIHTGTVTITNGVGPDGLPITITYQPPLVPSVPATSPPVASTTQTPPAPAAAAPSSSTPLSVTLGNTQFVTFTPNTLITAGFVITGGVAPYTVTIDWGDGSPLQTLTIQQAGPQSATHTYVVAQAYTLTLKVTDSSGQSSQISTAALTFAIPPTSGAGTTGTDANAPTAPKTITVNPFFVAWSSYAVVVGITASFWAGEIIAQAKLTAAAAHVIHRPVSHAHTRNVRHVRRRR